MKRPSVHQKLFWFYSIPVLVLMFLMLICCGLSIYNLNRQVTQLDQAALQNYADQLETKSERHRNECADLYDSG